MPSIFFVGWQVLASVSVGISRRCAERLADLFSPSIFTAPSVGSPTAGLFGLRF
jgi:hypothetical protein